jgi:phage gp36-like protein
MPAYVDIDFVKMVGSMPAADVDLIESAYPGTFAQLALSVSRIFDARLAKRYATPFASPYPEALRMHVANVVVWHLWRKRGFNPSSEQDALVTAEKEAAEAWLKEAADSKDGLVELPLRENATTSGVIAAFPLGSSDASPYTWIDTQAEALGRTS